MQMDAARLFCDVADTHSFTDAARLHGCSPANASLLFHAIEREFNMALAERGRRHVHLNPAGHVCYEYCRQMVGLADELAGTMDKIRAGIGSLEVAACPCIGLYPLPPLLRSFQQSFPEITVRIRLESHDRVHQAVLNNDVDAGLVPYPRRGPGLAVGIFRRVPLVLVCRPEHPLAALPLVTVRQLRNRRNARPEPSPPIASPGWMKSISSGPAAGRCWVKTGAKSKRKSWAAFTMIPKHRRNITRFIANRWSASTRTTWKAADSLTIATWKK